MLPIINVEPLLVDSECADAVVSDIGRACREDGFFYVRGHQVPHQLISRLRELAERFFASSLEEKRRLAMAHAGPALRGYFGVGDELTSGIPDIKEGLYFGEEHDASNPLVAQRAPLHGSNLYPLLPGFRETISEYMCRMKKLGDALMRGIALSLGFEASLFERELTKRPTQLFRIFHYPSVEYEESNRWGVGEHTDYGLLTILLQDNVGGLQVKSRGVWQDAPPVPDTFVCNIGDMLDRMTRGNYRSTPHRVRNVSGRSRFSFPYFYDPDWDAEVQVLPVESDSGQESSQRWDGANLSLFEGTYGAYISQKVSRVFPQFFN